MSSDLVNSDLAKCADDELVLRAQEKDTEAFAELMRRTSSSSLRLALSILRDRQEAEDQVQNSYFNAWRYVGDFQREAKFSTWISRIVTNQCLMRLRKLRQMTFVYLDDSSPPVDARVMELEDTAETPEQSLSGKEISGVVQMEIGKLPPILREVMLLRDMDQLPSDEVARRLNISVAAVKSRLLRARTELRRRIEGMSGLTPGRGRGLAL